MCDGGMIIFYLKMCLPLLVLSPGAFQIPPASAKQQKQYTQSTEIEDVENGVYIMVARIALAFPPGINLKLLDWL